MLRTHSGLDMMLYIVVCIHSLTTFSEYSLLRLQMARTPRNPWRGRRWSIDQEHPIPVPILIFVRSLSRTDFISITTPPPPKLGGDLSIFARSNRPLGMSRIGLQWEPKASTFHRDIVVRIISYVVVYSFEVPWLDIWSGYTGIFYRGGWEKRHDVEKNQENAQSHRLVATQILDGDKCEDDS